MLAVVTVSVGNTLYLVHSGLGDDSVDSPHVGVVDVNGAIAAGSDASSDRILSGVRRAMDNADSMSALILRINSPGGSPAESQRIFHEIRKQRELHPDTPIYSWVGDVGASGSYYIAAATEEIIATPSSLVGSIGVISSGFGFTDAMDQLGIERRVYTSGANKALLDPFQEQSDTQVEAWQQVIGSTHDQFINDVKLGREGKLDAYQKGDDVFSGMVWTGEQAIDMGLVDRLTPLDDVYREILPQEDGSRPEVVNYSVGMSAIERFSRSISMGIMETFATQTTAGMQYQWTP